MVGRTARSSLNLHAALPMVLVLLLTLTQENKIYLLLALHLLGKAVLLL